ncbi:hypothetical protein AAEX28_15340 [Lentisphaerota bacterium WC36G]
MKLLRLILVVLGLWSLSFLVFAEDPPSPNLPACNHDHFMYCR